VLIKARHRTVHCTQYTDCSPYILPSPLNSILILSYHRGDLVLSRFLHKLLCEFFVCHPYYIHFPSRVFLFTLPNNIRLMKFHVFIFIALPVTKTKLNSVALVRERNIPIERPSLVGEVSTNFLRKEGVAGLG
jgi:hypothetical protein